MIGGPFRQSNVLIESWGRSTKNTRYKKAMTRFNSTIADAYQQLKSHKNRQKKEDSKSSFLNSAKSSLNI